MIFSLDGMVLDLNASARRLYGLGRSTGSLEVAALAHYWYPDGSAVAEEETPAARVLRGESFTEYELWARTGFGADGHSSDHSSDHSSNQSSDGAGVDRRNRNNSGERRWLGAYSGTQIQDSVTFGVLAVRDVTKERELEARFKAAFEVNPTAISILRLADLRFNDVNESFLTLTGYTRDEVIGKTAAEIGLFLEYGKRETALRQLRRDGGDRVVEHEASLHKKTGEQRHILSEGRIIFFDGDPHLIDTYIDITDRKRSETELMQAIQATMVDPTWFSRVVMEKLAEIRAGSEEKPGLEQLTKREQGVLELLAQGLGNEQIARELGLSRHTVRNYVATIYSKLGVRSRAEAVIWARERGFISPT